MIEEPTDESLPDGVTAEETEAGTTHFSIEGDDVDEEVPPQPKFAASAVPESWLTAAAEVADDGDLGIDDDSHDE